MRRAAGMFMLAIVCMTTACGGSDKPTTTRPRSTATIAISKPVANAKISTKTFTVKLDLQGGKIVDIVSQDLTPNEGHLHVSVDGKILTQTFWLSQKLKTPKKGEHLLQAEFVAKDHGPFSPRVLSTIPFEVT